MKRGLAVPYIIALILGLIILAVAAYLIYKAVTGGELDCQECKAKFTTWCSMCYLANWEKDYELGEELSKCVSECGFWPGASEDMDCTHSNADESCKGTGVSF
jgi:hypothetical protein